MAEEIKELRQFLDEKDEPSETMTSEAPAPIMARRRRRLKMSAAARKAISIRMRRHWAERRAQSKSRE